MVNSRSTLLRQIVMPPTEAKGTDETRELTLSEGAWEEISRHAVEAFPDECCGVVLARSERDGVHRCANVQNRLHSLDPKRYPRSAATAYTMDFKELEAILQGVQGKGKVLKAFYHSHPGHEAYFSQEDKDCATPFGEPSYPDCAQLVISVYDRVVKEICAYAWSDSKKDFVRIPLRSLPSETGRHT